MALFDYDPVKSSTSDYPERELRLREGDYITVFGEMDSDGYLEAEINGKCKQCKIIVALIFVS